MGRFFFSFFLIVLYVFNDTAFHVIGFCLLDGKWREFGVCLWKQPYGPSVETDDEQEAAEMQHAL